MYVCRWPPPQEQACSGLLMVDGVAEKIAEEAFVARAESFAPDLVILEVSTASIDTDLRVVNNLRQQYPNFGLFELFARLSKCGWFAECFAFGQNDMLATFDRNSGL